MLNSTLIPFLDNLNLSNLSVGDQHSQNPTYLLTMTIKGFNKRKCTYRLCYLNSVDYLKLLICLQNAIFLPNIIEMCLCFLQT